MPTPKYVIYEGQLCRVVESYEPVDIAMEEAKVEQAQLTLEQRQAELAEAQSQVDQKTQEVEDAEVILEDYKRGLAAAQAMVDEPANDGEEAVAEGGERGEVENSESQY